MPHILVKVANAHFATMPILVGLSLLIRPDFIIPLIFRDPPIQTSNTELLHVLRMGFAIRDIYMGLILWTAIYLGNRKMVGLSLLAAICVVVVDGYALQQYLGRGLWDHWSFLPVVLGLGCWQAFF